MLVIRSSPAVDESPEGYLLRLATLNGLAGTRRIKQFWGMAGRFHYSYDEWRHVFNVLGISISPEDFAYTPSSNEKLRSFGRIKVASSALNLAKPRVCPKCIAACQYAMRLWDLKTYVACHLHGCVLMDQCPTCERSLVWTRSRIDRCACGTDLARWPVEPAPSSTVQISKLHAELAGLHERSTTLPEFDLATVMLLLRFFGSDPTSKRWRSAQMSSPTAQSGASMIQQTAAIVLEWPQGLYRWLEGHRLKTPGRTGLVADFGFMSQRLVNVFTEENQQIILDAVSTYLSSEWRGIKAGNIGKALRGQDESRMRLTAAKKLLRIPLESLAKMIEGDQISGLVLRHNKIIRGWAVTSEIMSLTEKMKNEKMSIKDAAYELETTTFQIRQLLSRGHLTALLFKKSTFIDRSSVITLLDKLNRACRSDAGKQDNNGVISLSDLTYNRSLKLISVLENILCGNISVLHLASDGRGLSKFGVAISKINLVRWGDDYLSVRQAQYLLLTRASMLKHLIQSGLVIGKVDKMDRFVRGSISKKSVLDFRLKYVMTNQIVIEGILVRDISSFLKSHGVQPVLPEDKSLSHSAVWSLDELEALDCAKITPWDARNRRGG